MSEPYGSSWRRRVKSKELLNMKLVLFFTRGVSLQKWDEAGMLNREVILYKKLRPSLSGITFVTYGDLSDLSYGDGGRLNDIDVIANRRALPQKRYLNRIKRLPLSVRFGPAIIKSNQTDGAEIALEAAGRSKKPFIARCGYMLSKNKAREYGEDSTEAKRAVALEGEVFEGADRIVVTTEAMREYAVEKYRLDGGKVRVIPNYVDTELFKPNPDVERSKNWICFIGRLAKEKNLFALLDAIKGLDVELDMVGEGVLGDELRRKAESDGLKVRFHGSVGNRELPRIINGSSLFVLPSLYEGHPKTLLEAMSCGVPVLGTDVPGIGDMIVHKENGFLCGTSPAEIRAAVEEMLGDKKLRDQIGREGRRFVLDNFDLKRIVEMELALYEELI